MLMGEMASFVVGISRKVLLLLVIVQRDCTACLTRPRGTLPLMVQLLRPRLQQYNRRRFRKRAVQQPQPSG